MRFIFACLLASMSFAALAQQAGDTTVPLPKPRPAELSAEPAVKLPRHRPAATPDKPAPKPPAADPIGPPLPPGEHVAEPAEPTARIYQTACPAVLLGKVEAKALPPIEEKQCGTQSPLSVTGVLANGRMVPVAGGVETDCGIASALPDWIESIDSYLMARDNTRIAEVVVGTSYMCRNVNNGSTGNLSFHAFADALDVVGFKLEDGRFVTVDGGWRDALSPEGRLLRFAHDSACAHFTTVLGPEANAEHHDHLHVDLGCHGKTCTARLCE
ncbi:hypothetical protein ASC89_11865 [Devosia sp. Root413D1]|uniref:extensin-like domain-containing protein n=1 Tax=Devosia sp. Root413D1 TaxID=1736531 RepID=UPI0006F94986|nr:extensin family protein [Devosia sp. Root413D1]KQW78998.1 hypothetical protein ASC89_11865 [Devosia sp. Root413D1]